MIKPYIKKLLIIVLLLTIGLSLQVAGLLDAEKLVSIAREYSAHWWLALVLILIQAGLFTFALAGSVFLWVVAPLYPPAMAAFILTAGATFGGIGAYFFSLRLTEDWIRKVESSHAYKLLHNQDNFFALFALRVLPAFPHSLVNYSSGILKVKLSHFIAAAILGVGIKSYVYSKVIYNAAASTTLENLLDFSTYGPLILLSAVSLIGVFIKYKITSRDK